MYTPIENALLSVVAKNQSLSEELEKGVLFGFGVNNGLGGS